MLVCADIISIFIIWLCQLEIKSGSSPLELWLNWYLFCFKYLFFPDEKGYICVIETIYCITHFWNCFSHQRHKFAIMSLLSVFCTIEINPSNAYWEYLETKRPMVKWPGVKQPNGETSWGQKDLLPSVIGRFRLLWELISVDLKGL